MGKVYLKVEEIDKNAVPWQTPGRPNPEKQAFKQEVLLRLEQTNGDKVIRFLFADRKQAEAYRNYVTQRVGKTIKPQFVGSQLMAADGGKWWVVFYRGLQWQRLPKE